MHPLKYLFLGTALLFVVESTPASEEFPEEGCWSFISRGLSHFINKLDRDEFSELRIENFIEEHRVEDQENLKLEQENSAKARLEIMWQTEAESNADIEQLRAKLDSDLHGYGRSVLALQGFSKRMECIEGYVAIFCSYAFTIQRNKLESNKERHQVRVQSAVVKLLGSSEPNPLTGMLGNALAQYNLGDLYYHGQGVPQNYEMAKYWFGQSAAQNNADAQNGLGVLYYYGRGVSQDYIKAKEWCEKSAAQNNADAQCNLANLYYYGQGVSQDYAKAKEWCEKSAAQNNANAQYRLARLYYHGRGVSQDYAKAKEWFEESAAQDNARAQYRFGRLYYRDKGINQNFNKAVEL
jgi:TPR repeat protein